MNQYVKAGILTVIFLGMVIAMATFFHVVGALITAEMAYKIIAIAGICICIYLIYMIFLSQVRYEAKLKSMVDKK